MYNRCKPWENNGISILTTANNFVQDALTEIRDH